MRQIILKPEIQKYATCKEFCEDFNIKEDDLIITNEYIYNPNFSQIGLKCHVLFQEKYGAGEPSDEMVEAIWNDIKDLGFKRIFAIGGGTIIDISKLFAMSNVSPVLDLYDKKVAPIKDKEVILVPTTCGTGSEVTNISILELKSRHTKLGLAVDELYADYAVLIPELLEGLPFKFFATSSIDAIIHAVESYVSPKATPYTETFALKAMEMIINGYKVIAEKGQEARMGLLEDFLIGSNFAGISFALAGTGAVHAMSYPFGAYYHVPHGEANYTFFTEVFKVYQKLDPNCKINKLNEYLGKLLDCKPEDVFTELEKLLTAIIEKKPLSAYGVKEEELKDFTENVMTKQGRLMANCCVPLKEEDVYGIYKALYK